MPGAWLRSSISLKSICLIAICPAFSNETFSLGLSRDGRSAQSQSLAGIEVVGNASVISGLVSNPANLPSAPGWEAETSLSLLSISTSFFNKSNSAVASKLDSTLIPDLALGFTPGNSRWSFGFGVSPDVALGANYTMMDPPGGADGVASYGMSRHRSVFLGVRTTVGAAYQLNDWITIGAGLGGIYNRNELESPYIFQGSHGLRGIKTQLDLETEGWGVAGQFGLSVRPNAAWRFGLSFNPGSSVQSEGRSSGNASAQLTSLGGAFATVQPGFNYDTRVEVDFPMSAQLGAEYQLTSKFKILSQMDWFGLSESFDALRIRLRNGDNPDLNGLLNSSGFDETSPLGWSDQWVFRVGAEYEFNPCWTFRTGYAHAGNPVPKALLTPLSGPIMDQVIGAGLFYSRGSLRTGVSFQYILPERVHVDSSHLMGGEYDGSVFKVRGQVVSAYLSWRFL